MSYKIFISTFGRKTMSVKGGISIEVGAEKRNNFIYELRDNTGDNISLKNGYYGELTGLYWVWKNSHVKDDDIIGFCHYNKALNIKRNKAEKWLRESPNGMITLSPKKIRNHPNHFEVQCLLKVLQRKYPKSYSVWHKLYDDEAAGRDNVCRGGNMFITTGATFKSYCSWLFDILFDLQEMVGTPENTDANMMRYCAFMAERLLSVFIETYDIHASSVEIKYKEWWLPYIRIIVKYLHVNRNTKFYNFLKQKFGYSSQYGRKE